LFRKRSTWIKTQRDAQMSSPSEKRYIKNKSILIQKLNRLQITSKSSLEGAAIFDNFQRLRPVKP
jgi:hypothetical protein